MQPPTAKGQLSRSKILEAALSLFAERGFEETTVQQIADRADVAVGLMYKHFPSKDAIILAYYEQLSDELEDFAARLPSGRVSVRYTAVLRHKFQRLARYRRALRGLTAIALDPEAEAGVMSTTTSRIRARNAAVYLSVVQGASDGPGAATQSLARVLYTADLLLVFAWMQDRSPGQRATGRLIDLLEDHLSLLPTLLWLPPVRAGLRQIEPILAEMLALPESLNSQEIP